MKLEINRNNVVIEERFRTYKITFNDKITVRINSIDILEALESMTDEVTFSNFVEEYNAKIEANKKLRQQIDNGTLPF